MWKVWMVFDPRRSLILIMAFGFFMAMLIHIIQFSTPRYGTWLNAPPENAKLQKLVTPSGG